MLVDILWDDYLEYLIRRGNLQKYYEYTRLWEILHNIEFTWIINRDKNRECDGIDMREDYYIPSRFLDQEDYFLNHWCSVMEMLVGLAIRVDNEFLGGDEPTPELFFMEMIDNLGLREFTTRHCSKNEVNRIIKKWLDRKFNKNGKGSPFPVRYDHRDQRRVEIWDQMNSYISENFI